MTRLIILLLVSAALQAQPADSEELLRQAIGLHQAGNIAAAIPLYEKYAEQRPDSLLALSNLGAAYAQAGRYRDAIAQYLRALKLQPGNPSVELNLALAYYKAGQLSRAAPILEKLHRAAPDRTQTTLLLADSWLAMGRYKEVDALLTPLFEKTPDNKAVTYMLGTALVRGGQTARGQVIIDRILRDGDSAEARLLLGATRLQAHEYPAALADLAKAAELNPGLPDVHALHGQALQATGDPAAAAAAYRRALAANQNSFTANLELGILLANEQKPGEALECLRRALQVRPDDLDARYHTALIHLQQDRVGVAREQLEQIVSKAPAFLPAHVTLATVYYRLKRKADAERERAIIKKLTAETQALQQRGVNVK